MNVEEGTEREQKETSLARPRARATERADGPSGLRARRVRYQAAPPTAPMQTAQILSRRAHRWCGGTRVGVRGARRREGEGARRGELVLGSRGSTRDPRQRDRDVRKDPDSRTSTAVSAEEEQGREERSGEGTHSTANQCFMNSDWGLDEPCEARTTAEGRMRRMAEERMADKEGREGRGGRGRGARKTERRKETGRCRSSSSGELVDCARVVGRIREIETRASALSE